MHPRRVLPSFLLVVLHVTNRGWCSSFRSGDGARRGEWRIGENKDERDEDLESAGDLPWRTEEAADADRGVEDEEPDEGLGKVGLEGKRV